MNIKEILQLIEDTKEILTGDFVYNCDKKPTQKDLLKHINSLIKESRVNEIVQEVLLEEDMDNDNWFRVLLVAAAISHHAAADS